MFDHVHFSHSLIKSIFSIAHPSNIQPTNGWPPNFKLINTLPWLLCLMIGPCVGLGLSILVQSHHHEATQTQGGHCFISPRCNDSQRRRNTHRHFALFGKHIRTQTSLLNGQPCQLWIPTHDFQLHLVVHIIRANNERMTGLPTLSSRLHRLKE